MPERLLIAAHIKPRRLLSDKERLDFASAAMLTCTLGCDALFERGYLVVDDEGQIVTGRAAETDALLREVNARIGARCAAHDERRRTQFADHRRLHAH